MDNSSRIQTISQDDNKNLYDLIKIFKNKTKSSVLVNTSFNVRGEPMVLTAEDSYRCFMRTNIDVLVIEDYLFIKNNQPPFIEKNNWKEEFEKD